MLVEQPWRYQLSRSDLEIFDAVVPVDHPLRTSLKVIPWDSFVPILENYYKPNRGQPALSPLLMLKLVFLQYQFNLSDRQVMERADTDLLFRMFLQVPLRFQLPDASLLTKFRGRLGAEGFKQVFSQLVSYAREAGLVKDRLRLKDASHVIANIAVPTTLQLLAQLRERLLERLGIFDAEAAAGFRIAADLIHVQSAGQEGSVQLETRIQLIQDILRFIQKLPEPEQAPTNRRWQELQAAVKLAEKILYDQAHPEEGRRTLSVMDEEARRGKHGQWYDGYVLDLMMDADSQLITQIAVLEAGGDEAQSAVELVRGEQETHGNQIEKFSIDGAGFNGPMLRQMESPDELNVQVFVPPKSMEASDLFPSSSFTLTADREHVTCPVGELSSYRQRNSRDRGTIFRFKRSQCDACPLVAQCMPKPGTGAFGRSVTKSDYEAEYDRARARAQTAAYREIRREHPAIERKINEVMNQHGGRRARYWGHAKLIAQECMTCFSVNAKRILKLLALKVCAYQA